MFISLSSIGIGAYREPIQDSQQSAQELPTLSQLRVSGNRIVNEEGQAIRLRGVNVFDPLWLDQFDYSGDGLPDHRVEVIGEDFARVKALGANIVRLQIYPGYFRLLGGERYLTTYFDHMVDLAEAHGLYVIISYHAIGRPGGWYESSGDLTLPDYPAKMTYTDTDMAVAFWDTVAARYGQRKHVLFGIYNEPADETATYTWADWRPTGELLIATIRQHSDNIVLGPGPEYTSDLSAVPSSPYSDSNLVYDVHIYPIQVPKGEDHVTEWERLFGFLAETYPIIVGEWGFRDGSIYELTDGTLEGYGKPFIDYLDQKSLHWVAFLYDAEGEPAMVETDWVTLTEFGRFVKERLSTESTPKKDIIQPMAQPLPGYPAAPLGISFAEHFNGSTVNEDLFEIKSDAELWTSWLDASKTSVQGGSLLLKTDASDTRNGLLKVGGVVSHALYSYGTFTVRAKNNPAPGTLGAMYLYNEDKDMKDGGRHEEIDIELSYKFPGQASLVTFHNDDWKSSDLGLQNDMHRGGIKHIREIAGLEQFDNRAFNTYVIDWQPGTVTWYINGIRVEEVTDAVPSTPMQIHLDTYNNSEWDAFIDPEPVGIGVMEIDSITYVPFAKR